MRNGSVFFLVFVVSVVSVVTQSLAATPSQSGGLPPYPRVNMCTWYEVDAQWPRRPADATWGGTSGLAVDGEDRVWVFTRGTPPIQVYDAQGNYVRGWGSDVIGSAHFIRFDSRGHVWAVDVGKHVVLEYTPEGKLLRTLGTPGTVGEDATHFNKPTDVAVTPDGDIFVSDGYGNSRVVHFDKSGRFVKAWGKLGTGPGEFSLVHSIVVDSRGRLYVADRNNVRIQVFDQSGKFLEEWRDLMVPWGLWITKSDEIWACGSSPMPWQPGLTTLGTPPKDQIFLRFDTTGRVRQLVTVPKGQDGAERPGECNWVHTIAVDSKGNVYVGDIQGKRVQKFMKKS